MPFTWLGACANSPTAAGKIPSIHTTEKRISAQSITSRSDTSSPGARDLKHKLQSGLHRSISIRIVDHAEQRSVRQVQALRIRPRLRIEQVIDLPAEIEMRAFLDRK